MGWQLPKTGTDTTDLSEPLLRFTCRVLQNVFDNRAKDPEWEHREAWKEIKPDLKDRKGLAVFLAQIDSMVGGDQIQILEPLWVTFQYVKADTMDRWDAMLRKEQLDESIRVAELRAEHNEKSAPKIWSDAFLTDIFVKNMTKIYRQIITDSVVEIVDLSTKDADEIAEFFSRFKFADIQEMAKHIKGLQEASHKSLFRGSNGSDRVAGGVPLGAGA